MLMLLTAPIFYDFYGGDNMKINDLTLPRDLLHEQTVCWPDQGITVMLGQKWGWEIDVIS